MSYYITKIPQPCGHAFQVAVPDEGGIGRVVAEIRFHGVDSALHVAAGRAANAMVDAMDTVWHLTADGPREAGTVIGFGLDRLPVTDRWGRTADDRRKYRGQPPKEEA